MHHKQKKTKKLVTSYNIIICGQSLIWTQHRAAKGSCSFLLLDWFASNYWRAPLSLRYGTATRPPARTSARPCLDSPLPASPASSKSGLSRAPSGVEQRLLIQMRLPRSRNVQSLLLTLMINTLHWVRFLRFCERLDFFLDFDILMGQS